MQGYGLSEFPTIATHPAARGRASRTPARPGRPCSITQLAIQLDDGTIADAGEGEILLRTPATMVGYYDRPEETAAAFADGWLHTGDLGRVDEDGYVEITGRKKDMIISGGLNVYPKEVEEVIYRQARGRRGRRRRRARRAAGARSPVAVVVARTATASTRPPCSRPAASSSRRYKRPRAVLVHEDPLPRNPSGKVLKRELRPWAAERVQTIHSPEVPSA